ncbi:MAG: HDIG domain-containing protein [Candidatus Kapabacteria bacterium]|nr:HDIG domain-containing protein [Candidatus Kapabacteria bacterium]
MARSRPTLFEQIRDDGRETESQGGMNRSVALRVVIITMATLLMMAFLPGRLGEIRQAAFDRSRMGTTWTEESLVADYPFPVQRNADSVSQDRAAARGSVPAYVRRTPEPLARALQRLSVAVTAATDDELRRALTDLGEPALRQLYAPDAAEIIDADLRTIPKADVMTRDADGSEFVVCRHERLRDSASVAEGLDNLLVNVPTKIRQSLRSRLHASVVPTLRLDRPTWQHEQQLAEQGVTTTQEIVRKGDVIIRKGDRIDEHFLSRLASYRYAEYIRSTSQFSFLVAVGSAGHALVLIAIVCLYLYFVRRSSFVRNGQLATLLAMPVASAGLGWLSIALPSALPLEYTIIVPGFAMLVSILYDVRTSIVVTLSCALSVAAARGNDHVIAVVLIAGGAMAAYSATNLRSRTQIFTSILAILAGLVIVTLSIELENGTPLINLATKLGGALVNSIISPLLAVAAILLMERTLNVATDLRLEDFDDINHPLIHQLNQVAPGTYQHTMAVVHLSETAASAIGANPLLARVGALYHDIGKITKSEYFIENQIDIDNKHDRLTPRRSAEIIRQHVTDGIDLAKEYRLPDRIWKFIPMHHGTILIKHFYAKAIEEAADGPVDASEFRYPGPRPDSKETAIVMLADAAEALSRLVDSGDREEIEKAIDQIFMDRFIDGQLDDTPLTLSDLNVIRESFVNSLIGSSHQRVRYAEVRPSEDASS